MTPRPVLTNNGTVQLNLPPAHRRARVRSYNPRLLGLFGNGTTVPDIHLRHARPDQCNRSSSSAVQADPARELRRRHRLRERQAQGGAGRRSACSTSSSIGLAGGDRAAAGHADHRSGDRPPPHHHRPGRSAAVASFAVAVAILEDVIKAQVLEPHRRPHHSRTSGPKSTSIHDTGHPPRLDRLARSWPSAWPWRSSHSSPARARIRGEHPSRGRRIGGGYLARPGRATTGARRRSWPGSRSTPRCCAGPASSWAAWPWPSWCTAGCRCSCYRARRRVPVRGGHRVRSGERSGHAGPAQSPPPAPT